MRDCCADGQSAEGEDNRLALPFECIAADSNTSVTDPPTEDR